MKPLFLLEQGFIGREGNSLVFNNAKKSYKLPIKEFNSIYFLEEVSFNSKFLSFLSKEKIPAYFFGYFGNYLGCFYPFKKKWFSGKTLLNQAKHCFDLEKRLFIANEIVSASIHNMRKILLKAKLERDAKNIESLMPINNPSSINSLMIIEANARRIYYSCFNKLLKNPDYSFDSRSFNPPTSKMNCLLSFGNALLYSICLSEAYKTLIDPSISFVHEPTDNRHSLIFDIADIFKPIIVDRLIFSLINLKSLNDSMFEKKGEGIYLTKKGKEIFLRHFNQRIRETVKIKEKSVSYRFIIRKEFIKLAKHVDGEKNYKSFRMWW